MKKELFEKIEKMGLFEDVDLQALREDIDDGVWVSDMYGSPEPREKNINRVVAGLRASGAMAPELIQPFGQPQQPQAGGVSQRYVQALEMQIQHLQKQLRQLHGQYQKLTKSQNAIVDRINKMGGSQ